MYSEHLHRDFPVTNLIVVISFIYLSLWSGPIESAYLTVKNETCEIPFLYKGKTYYDCVKGALGRPWCAIKDANYDASGLWNWCQEKPTPDEEQCANMRVPNVTLADVKLILEEHNALRSYVNSTVMMRLKWSNSLAKRAQYFAETCPKAHAEASRCSGEQVGQNFIIQKGVNIYPTPQGWTFTLRYDWGEYERGKYNLKTGQCSGDGVCGHYEQIVWSTTEEVGCGMAMCENKMDEYYPYYVVYACHYSPAGRYEGMKPYTEGQPCSECANRAYPRPYKCVDGLCEFCSDPKEDSCQPNDCRDLMDCSAHKNQFCSSPAIMKDMQSQMPSVFAYLRQNCQKSCSFCGN